jgi:hypothetical protein
MSSSGQVSAGSAAMSEACGVPWTRNVPVGSTYAIDCTSAQASRGCVNCGRISSHSPSTATSAFSFLRVVPGVVEACGPTTTIAASGSTTVRIARSVAAGTRSSGGAQRQKR